MSAWEQLQRDHPHLKKWVSVGLTSAYQYYGKMDRTPSYIVAMCKHVDYTILESAIIVP